MVAALAQIAKQIHPVAQTSSSNQRTESVPIKIPTMFWGCVLLQSCGTLPIPAE